ncbi:MAG TPA: hypothetical protein VMM12_05120 [Longimicrobiales bacterium]|nr:hypothetical protein [Longimicrobiales bacterium]
MRTTLIALLALALPTVLTAQEASELDGDAPRVQIEQTTDAAESPAPALDRVELDAERTVDAENRTSTADAAAVQEPGSRQFWYIVLAVVVGVIIVAVLL